MQETSAQQQMQISTSIQANIPGSNLNHNLPTPPGMKTPLKMVAATQSEVSVSTQNNVTGS